MGYIWGSDNVRRKKTERKGRQKKKRKQKRGRRSCQEEEAIQGYLALGLV